MGPLSVEVLKRLFSSVGFLFTLDGMSEAAKEGSQFFVVILLGFCDAGVFVKYLILQDRSQPGQDRAVPHDNGVLLC